MSFAGGVSHRIGLCRVQSPEGGTPISGILIVSASGLYGGAEVVRWLTPPAVLVSTSGIKQTPFCDIGLVKPFSLRRTRGSCTRDRPIEIVIELRLFGEFKFLLHHR